MQMNSRTTRDNYALPRIREILDALSGNLFFTVLDMKSGYLRIEILEEHKQRITFTDGPHGGSLSLIRYHKYSQMHLLHTSDFKKHASKTYI